MTPEEWQDIKRHVSDALALESTAQADYLRQLAAMAPETYREVASLLRAAEANSGFLDTGYVSRVVEEGRAAGPCGFAGRRLGAYQLLEEVGEGGMGTVYRAVRADGAFERQVAVKMIRLDRGGEFFLRHFNTERQILARLDHPSIARVLDGGATEQGVPYVVMEFVDGVPIDEYCKARMLSIPERLELFCAVCSAVQHAHQNLIVHRDLKPGNVLVTPDGQPKLLDFGIAKILELSSAAADPGFTLIPIMTPDFASPEQVRGEPITTASDVYALGVVLYVLLTGQRPYRAANLSIHEIMKAICDTEPPRPSAALSAPGGDAPPIDWKRLRRTLRGDLDSMVLKAMRKIPSERYATVEQLSADVRRHLDGLPVLARRGSNGYRLRKFVTRHATGVAVATGVAAVLIGSMLISLWEAREARHQYERTLQAQSRLLTEAAAQHLKDWDVGGAQGIILEVLNNPQFAAIHTPAALSVFQEIRAADTAIAVLSGHGNTLISAAYSPDGTRIVTASRDKTARIWDARTGQELAVLVGHDDTVDSAAYSPDGTRIVTASDDKTARIWDARTGKELAVLVGHGNTVDSAAYSPDGTRIVTASDDKTARIWDAHTGQELAVLAGHGNFVDSAAYSPDGTRIVTASDDKTARIWNAGTGKELVVLSGHGDFVYSAAYSPDGMRIVTASDDKTARIWNAGTGAQLAKLSGHSDIVRSAAFSPDGTRVVTASRDRTVRIWDAGTGAQLATLSGHGNTVDSAAYSPDGSRIVTASDDKTARIWDARSGSELAVFSGDGNTVDSAAYSPDGRRIVLAFHDNTARILDARTGTQLATLSGHGNFVYFAAYSPDGTRIVTASDDKTARIWDARTGAQLAMLSGHGSFVYSAAYSPDGTRIVTASADKTARIWSARTGEELLVLSGHGDLVYIAAYSPDGTRIVTASDDKTARIWDARTGAQLAILSGHANTVDSAAYSPDGTRIVTASADKTARIWNARTGEELAVLSGHGNTVYSAAYSPDGKRVVTASFDKTARIWDARTGEELAVLSGHGDFVYSAAYSPDGTRIVTASHDKTARIWDAHVPATVTDQILWYAAARTDWLPDLDRAQLGLFADARVRRWGNHGSACDQAAAAFYDPDRTASGTAGSDINTDIASPACAAETSRPGYAVRLAYQWGRTLWAMHDLTGARRQFELAISKGYRAAGIDFGNLLTDGRAGIVDPERAVSLYEKAWRDGVAIAAFGLGRLYESGLPVAEAKFQPNAAKAWAWYQKGANVGEPTALARFGERDERNALAEQDPVKSNALLLEAFRFYAAAVERAGEENWPDDAWRHWRYRRGTLARVLAREGMMSQVAQAYAALRQQHGTTLREEITARIHGWADTVRGHVDWN